MLIWRPLEAKMFDPFQYCTCLDVLELPVYFPCSIREDIDAMNKLGGILLQRLRAWEQT